MDGPASRDSAAGSSRTGRAREPDREPQRRRYPARDAAAIRTVDAAGVADNRLRFLTRDPSEPRDVRPTILASWQRSRALNVAADRVEQPYVRDPNLDTPLIRSAEPILARLHGQLRDQPVSIVLTDAAGLVLSRRGGDAELERNLDRVLLAPGFSYAEQFVGTNGIGTALEAGSATQVFGHEHYAENLEDLACAGVPVHDPISGRLAGVVDLTCWRRHAGTLLLTLANSTADQIQQAMLANANLREFEMLQAYLQTCRRTTGIVFAITDGALMLNDRARAELDLADRDALLAQATQASSGMRGGQRRSLPVALPSGRLARMYCQQVLSAGAPAGLVVHVKISELDDSVRGADSHERHVSGPRMLLPGLVGDAPLWQRACRAVEAAVAEGSWLAVDGETGTGKLALLRAVQLRQQPPRRLAVLDAVSAGVDAGWASTVAAELRNADAVILAHVDRLDARALRALSATLQDARRDPACKDVWVAVTLQADATRTAAVATQLGAVLSLFPTTVSVPALRLRMTDLPALVTFLLAKLGHGSHVSCSPQALRLMMRSSWPGNVAQLQQLLHQVVQRRRSGAITVDDLPPELHAVSRRVLSTLESMERDAIVRTLVGANGNKVHAARSLGMSRATIYRKIREYGILTPDAT